MTTVRSSNLGSGHDRSPFLALLEAERADLLAHLRRDGIEIEPCAEQMEQAQALADRDRAARELNAKVMQLREIEAAIERITDGTYGVCECGAVIPRKRLLLVPAARLCMRCQEEVEGGAA